MMKKIALMISLLSVSGVTMSMMVQSKWGRRPGKLSEFDKKGVRHFSEAGELITFVRLSPKSVQDRVLNDLGVESREDFNRVIRIAGSNYAQEVPCCSEIFDMGPEAREMAEKMNNHFATTGATKMNVTKSEYNAISDMPFSLKKGYRDTRFFKVAVMPTGMDQCKRVVITAAIGAGLGFLVGAVVEGGRKYGENIRDCYDKASQLQINTFKEEFSGSYQETFSNVYKSEALGKAKFNETFANRMLEGRIIEPVLTGSGDDSVAEQMLDGAKEGGVNGAVNKFFTSVFNDSVLGNSHNEALQIAGEAALDKGVSTAVNVLSALPLPQVECPSWSDMQRGGWTGAWVGAGVSFVWSMLHCNEPVHTKRISEINDKF